VAAADLKSLFEAARWAASSYNEQPWRFIVAQQHDKDEFDQMLSCLVDANKMWAQNAPVLVVGAVCNSFASNDKTNTMAVHDLGLASANIIFEATNRDLYVHHMVGFYPDRARELYRIPEGYEAVTMFAIGYAAELSSLPDNIRKRDESPRTRRAISEFVFSGSWENGASLD
jgi:nitroreductase